MSGCAPYAFSAAIFVTLTMLPPSLYWGAVILGWREAGRLVWMGARVRGRRQGRWARVPACWGRGDGGEKGTEGRSQKLETSKEHPRNMLATCLQQWEWSSGATGLAGR